MDTQETCAFLLLTSQNVCCEKSVIICPVSVLLEYGSNGMEFFKNNFDDFRLHAVYLLV